jgi:DmsE family decaheme c-type cytochrome
MGSRLTMLGVSVVMLLGLSPAVLGQQNPYRLKELDQKKACLSCHADFDQKLKKPFVHTPVKTGACSGCHDPHASSHAKLLAEDTRQMCTGCHGGIIPANAKSAHKVVADRQCEKCHDPHASENPANLLARGDALCFGCHKELGEAVAQAKFKHSPVQEGCQTCHDPHGSDKAVALLKDGVPALCLTCHQPDTPAFRTRHMNYPVAKASCTSCHDPHGSNQPALLLNDVHAPVASRTCGVCHDAPTSATPFATKLPGYELCRTCHSDTVTAILAKKRLHWPVADEKGCVNCHNPHAARHDKLLEESGAALCRGCHESTVKRIAATAVQHEPVKDGSCVSCHSPHGSDTVYLVDQPSINALCTTCHDYAQHSAHPIGEKAVDPRNKNLRVDCLSCHKAHGTDYKWMLLNATNVELCTRCHKKFAR